jgi:hypothetical protein
MRLVFHHGVHHIVVETTAAVEQHRL